MGNGIGAAPIQQLLAGERVIQNDAETLGGQSDCSEGAGRSSSPDVDGC